LRANDQVSKTHSFEEALMKRNRSLAFVLLSLLISLALLASCGDDSSKTLPDKGPGPDIGVPDKGPEPDGEGPDGPLPDMPVSPDIAGDMAPDMPMPDLGPDGPPADAAVDICSKAKSLTLTSGKGTVSDEILKTDTNNDIQIPKGACVVGAPTATQGAEHFYGVTLDAGKTYKITVDDPNDQYNIAIYVSTDCTSMGATCIAGADKEYATGTEVLFVAPKTTGTYYIGIDSRYKAGASNSYGKYDLTVEEFVLPAHDVCSSAKKLAFQAGNIEEKGDTRGFKDDVKLTASDCTGNTTDGPDLFFEVDLNAGSTYKLKLDGDGSGFNEVLYLFSSCTNVSGTCSQGMGADSSTSTAEEITFNPTTTGKYIIGVDGRGATDAGLFTLTVNEYPAITNDTCANATAITMASGKATANGHNLGATDTVNLPATGCTGEDTEGGDVFYSMQLTAGKAYKITMTPVSGFNAGVYVLSDCANPTTKCVAGADKELSGTAEVTYFTPTTTGTYYFVVDSRYKQGDSYSEGSFSLEIEEVTPPANQACTSAELLTLASGTVSKSGTTGGATDEVRLLATDCTGETTDGPDVFYKMTMTAGNGYIVNLTSSEFNESLYVFSDCSDVAGTCKIGADLEATAAEEVSFVPATTGTYYIGVDSRTTGDQGAFTLQVDEITGLEANNACANAKALTLSGTPPTATETGDNTKAINSIALPSSGSCTGYRSPGPDLFYKLDLTANTKYTFTLTPASTFDSMLYIFTDCQNPVTTCAEGDDNVGDGNAETFDFTPTTAGTYYIAVDSWYDHSDASSKGTFTLKVEQAP
jgi:hypothetical protein